MRKKYNLCLLPLANYLILLYYCMDKKYNCNLSKISKLLMIYILFCLKNNESIPLEGISNMNVYFLNYFFFQDIIVDGVKQDGIIEFKIDYSSEIPRIYEFPIDDIYIDKITPFTCDLLINIFIRFGNYSNLELYNLLDSFMKEVCILDNENNWVINQEKCDTFFSNKIKSQKFKENPIIEFIVNYKSPNFYQDEEELKQQKLYIDNFQEIKMHLIRMQDMMRVAGADSIHFAGRKENKKESYIDDLEYNKKNYNFVSTCKSMINGFKKRK